MYFKSLDSSRSTAAQANRVRIVLREESSVRALLFLSLTSVSVTPSRVSLSRKVVDDFQLRYLIRSRVHALHLPDLFDDLIGCNDGLMKTA